MRDWLEVNYDCFWSPSERIQSGTTSSNKGLASPKVREPYCYAKASGDQEGHMNSRWSRTTPRGQEVKEGTGSDRAVDRTATLSLVGENATTLTVMICLGFCAALAI